MVEGTPDQAHRSGHVREDLISKKPDGLAEPRFDSPVRTGARKSKRVTLGRHGVISAEQARRMAALTIARMKQGEDLNRARPGALSIQVIAEETDSRNPSRENSLESCASLRLRRQQGDSDIE